ncbi:MAG: tRNA lysidine(34) synthetase TilS, partial [Bacilli bacterium]|nr:tRNA lysidine(34) synthetase TilS [Bacilli bacterium]
NSISFKIMTIDSYNNTNIENQAREKRYDFFAKTVKKCQAKHLLTAHHGDDLTETILMRIVRGSTLKGYQGFKEKVIKDNYTILRPLIQTTKEDILVYCKNHNIPYAIDKTNEEDTYTRNRYRKYILPKLKEENKNVHKKFYKFSQTLGQYTYYINDTVAENIKNVYKNNILDIPKFIKLKPLIQTKIIYHILENYYGNDINLITDKHTELILKLLISNKPNQSINLPKKIKAIKAYNNFYLEKNETKEGYKLELKEKTDLPSGQISQIKTSSDHSNYTIYLNSSELQLPLFIRTINPSDKIAIKGLNGSKKVKDIFIDEKIPREKRQTWPILIDSNNTIIWLPGLKKSKFDKKKDENYDIILKYVPKEGVSNEKKHN